MSDADTIESLQAEVERLRSFIAEEAADAEEYATTPLRLKRRRTRCIGRGTGRRRHDARVRSPSWRNVSEGYSRDVCESFGYRFRPRCVCRRSSATRSCVACSCTFDVVWSTSVKGGRL